ncbi:hypothetical protein BGW36DRAFT_433602 [Talaromyces proteolyticus]|uniref:Zn(2)-C6 fungal-type domain-containing protein n=1 Tax=Talaromyces proteolyticus TaxID=1131652 RepID=A0AAD4KE06_9EURO|nr:uncharacterized protein BGW36DRAFT_433602 [Talaromyces proteolyticus]KAH8689599.1 hypothetical protein BGW36DRAFT_433602 [Talaromyces proteolyticus]
MAAQKELSDADKNVRGRRGHRKSRSGCANCKLRSVKCDEGFPECGKCLSFGVRCNYDLRIPDLQPRFNMATRKLNGKTQTCNALTSAEGSRLELTEQDLIRLERFKIRTALSLGPPELRQIYDNEIYRLILRHPFLMHIAHTLTLIHDRYSLSIPGQRTVEEIRHWSKGIGLFNKKLSVPLHPADRDAIWAGTSMLGVITFASIDFPTRTDETWPLTSLPKAEPEWLKMVQGKASLRQLIKPDRPDSMFYSLSSAIPTVKLAPENIPLAFIKLYQLDGSFANNNPYAIPVRVIFAAKTIEEYPSSSATALFYEFIYCIQNEFSHLVLNKDPRALLIMVYWYSKICTGQWWLRRRALIEGRATCTFLEKYYAHDAAIQDLLRRPRNYLFQITFLI